jgi:hypothetical protein
MVGTCQSADLFPFVIRANDSSSSATDMSYLSSKPAGEDGFVHIQDGHFQTSGGRLRIWGVNTVFSANFPEHEDAEKVAAHLGKLGINAVRIHHHDRSDAPEGLWGGFKDGKRVFNPDQVDRLDYFLSQLHQNGIYANLNLHVSRTFTEEEGFVVKGLPGNYNKYVLYFEPRMRELFKDYCRTYLLHVNPYRNLRRVDDPGIAMVEITNENAFSRDGAGVAAALPEPYRGEFKAQWNAWLLRHYSETKALRDAWTPKEESVSEILIEKPIGKTLAPWKLSLNKPDMASPFLGRPGPEKNIPALELKTKESDGVMTHQELMHGGISLEEGSLYTLSFWVRADTERSIYVDVSREGPPKWDVLGYKETLRLDETWKQIVRVFKATESVNHDARVCFKFGNTKPSSLYLADVRLEKGGSFTELAPDQSIEAGNIEIPVSGWPEQAIADVHQFMVDTEVDFLKDMKAFLKDELGVKVPITGSQVKWHGPAVVAASCDYTDAHGYWSHPQFPPSGWNLKNWTVPNEPMERHPDSNGLMARLAPLRLLDRPFILSEWNAAAPMDTAASAVAFGAVIPILQDWDGVFFFQYNIDTNWYGDQMRNFFSMNGHPTKLALMTAFAPMVHRGDLPSLTHTMAGTFDSRISPTLAFNYRIGIDPKAAEAPAQPEEGKDLLISPDQHVVWDNRDPAKAHVTLNTDATRAVWGFVAGQKFKLGGLTVTVGKPDIDYAVIVMTSLDGLPLESSKRMLLTLTGIAENTGMQWNEARTSVGDQWGKGPTLVNGIPAEIMLSQPKLRVFSLDPRGQRLAPVSVEQTAGTSQFSVGPEYKTLWYELISE